MAWTPSTNTFDITPLAPNLFAFIEANQEDALAWAANGNTTVARIEKFYKSAAGRITSVFPLLTLTTQTLTTDERSDELKGAYALTFEVMIKSGDSEQITTDAAIYAAALDSMLADIPSETLTAGMRGKTVNAENALRTVRLGVLRGDGSIFFQVIEASVTYSLSSSSYI